jgi:hypothetical protein
MSGRDLLNPPNAPDDGAAARMTEKLLWRFNRLRCMSPGEVVHRVRRTLAVGAQRSHLFRIRPVPEPRLDARARPWVHRRVAVDATPYLQAADRIAAGRMDIFALRDVQVGSPPRWNRDPKTGIEAPVRFGKTLDYRDPALVGDIKYLWELNRHLHIVTLAQAWTLSGDRKYFDVIADHLESWFDACPYPLGANWTSSLEAGLRLINWSAAWQLLGGAHSPLFNSDRGMRLRRTWLESVYRHCTFIHGYFSLYSSANNHLIGEAAGLYIASQTWPLWPRASAWGERAKAILEREAPLQTAADGVNREQAVAYQHFVLDLLLLAMLAGKANRQWFSVAYESRVEAMMEYLASIMDVGGNLPMIGDADDARVVGLAPETAPGCKSSLATGAILYGRGDFKFKAGALDDRTRWLLGPDADDDFAALERAREGQLPVRRAFHSGGYYVLGCDFESRDEIRLIVDAGPLGYQAIAAHGHADALAFTLSVGGLEFFIDPGTYAYHTQGPWRRYFRGTAAHNTVRVDARDQSQPGGNFMWLRKAHAGCSAWATTASRDEFEGWHDGYTHLDDPVLHRRRIALDKGGRRALIEDVLKMEGTHEIELLFHCNEHCRVDRTDDGFSVRRDGREVRLRLPQREDGYATVHVGATRPIAGWVSRRFDSKSPSPTIVWQVRARGMTVLQTEIAC